MNGRLARALRKHVYGSDAIPHPAPCIIASDGKSMVSTGGRLHYQKAKATFKALRRGAPEGNPIPLAHGKASMRRKRAERAAERELIKPVTVQDVLGLLDEDMVRIDAAITNGTPVEDFMNKRGANEEV